MPGACAPLASSAAWSGALRGQRAPDILVQHGSGALRGGAGPLVFIVQSGLDYGLAKGKERGGELSPGESWPLVFIAQSGRDYGLAKGKSGGELSP